jgi:hypothetical protein
MGLPRGYQVFTAKLENHLSGTHGTDDIFVHVCNGIAGDLERVRSALRTPIILAEFLKVIGYLTVHVGQTHLRSYQLVADSASAARRE